MSDDYDDVYTSLYGPSTATSSWAQTLPSLGVSLAGSVSTVTNNVTVDFTDVITATDPLGLGVVITEFGGSPVIPLVSNANNWQTTMTSLAPGHLRCSIAYYSGNPGYGAGGSPGEQGTGGTCATALINAIKTTGAIPLVSFNGNSSDNNFVPADGGSLVHFFNDDGGQNGGPIQYWSIGNEPEDGGAGTVATYESASGTGSAEATLTAMLGADSTINVGIPAAAYWDTSILQWAATVPSIGCLSYHAYDALDSPGSDNGGGGFYETGQYYTQTGTMRGYKSGLLYGVEEFNANSNASSSTTVTFTTSWKETCWIADVCGQLLSSGAHGTVFGDSNDGLSVISDGSSGLPSIGTPMPAYWGLGIWTGMNTQFKRWSSNMVSATVSTFANTVSAYACDNGKIVLVNKDTSSHALTIGTTFPGSVTSGTYDVWVTNSSTPSDPITQAVTQATFTDGTITYTIPAQTAVSMDVFTASSSFLYVEDFENGSNGTTITTSNSGGGSDQAFDGVTIGTGCTSVFSDAEANSGSLSGTVEVGSTAAPVYWQWTFQAAPATLYFRFYVYLTAAPVADDTVIMWNVSEARSCLFQITAAQKWLFQDNAFNESDAFTSVIPLDQWTRLDGYITWATSGNNGTLVMNYYQTASSSTPTETHTWTGVDTGTAANQVWVGWPSGGHASQPLTYWDDIAVSDSPISPVTAGYTETLTTGMSVNGHVSRAVSRKLTVAASVTGKVLRGIRRSLVTRVGVKPAVTPENVGTVISGSFHIVFPGSGACESTFSVALPGLTGTLTGVVAFNARIPALRTSFTAKIQHNHFNITLLLPKTSLTGKDVHNLYRTALPGVSVSLTGVITHTGSFSVALWARHVGLGEEEIEEPIVAQWQTGSLYHGWNTKNVLWKEWTVGYSTLLLSHLSTEYVLIPVAATQSGASYNPTSDTVQFAFMPTPTQIPGVSDWINGSWETVSTSVLYPYNAKCLVGPSGNINLVQGTYSVYVKITDSPEVPVLTAGQLVVS